MAVNFFDDRYENTGLVVKYRRDFLIDTDTETEDLPGLEVVRAGSLAYSVESGSLYILNGSGEWVKTKTSGGGDDPGPGPEPEMPTFELSEESLSMVVGDSQTVSITQTSAGSGWEVVTDMGGFVSGDDSIATVSSDGDWDVFTVTANGGGETTIYVTVALYNSDLDEDSAVELKLPVSVGE